MIVSMFICVYLCNKHVSTSLVTSTKVPKTLRYIRVKFTFSKVSLIVLKMTHAIKFSFRLYYQLFPGDPMLYLYGMQYFDQCEDCETGQLHVPQHIELL